MHCVHLILTLLPERFMCTLFLKHLRIFIDMRRIFFFLNMYILRYSVNFFNLTNYIIKTHIFKSINKFPNWQFLYTVTVTSYLYKRSILSFFFSSLSFSEYFNFHLNQTIITRTLYLIKQLKAFISCWQLS